ncbi:MAG TPA: hypothetical protein VM487_02275 [Phycisphaerae bacterium]|nr:hypothetical protein [Phycisphaerae bacterium]
MRRSTERPVHFGNPGHTVSGAKIPCADAPVPPVTAANVEAAIAMEEGGKATVKPSNAPKPKTGRSPSLVSNRRSSEK